MAKYLDIFGDDTCGYGVMLGDYDPNDPNDYATAVFFGTEAEAKEFVALARAGASGKELDAFLEARYTPREHITVEELRRRAETDDYNELL